MNAEEKMSVRDWFRVIAVLLFGIVAIVGIIVRYGLLPMLLMVAIALVSLGAYLKRDLYDGWAKVCYVIAGLLAVFPTVNVLIALVGTWWLLVCLVGIVLLIVGVIPWGKIFSRRERAPRATAAPVAAPEIDYDLLAEAIDRRRNQ